MSEPGTTTAETREDFVDECHFSDTGFALWKWSEHGVRYCTCDPRPKPAGWITEEDYNLDHPGAGGRPYVR